MEQGEHKTQDRTEPSTNFVTHVYHSAETIITKKICTMITPSREISAGSNSRISFTSRYSVNDAVT